MPTIYMALPATRLIAQSTLPICTEYHEVNETVGYYVLSSSVSRQRGTELEPEGIQKRCTLYARYRDCWTGRLTTHSRLSFNRSLFALI
jgi:hypothetical protein